MEKNKNLQAAIKWNYPKRLLILLALTSLASLYFPSPNINESQYFWILGSFVQGFSAFTGIVIASLTLGTNKIFVKRVNITDPEKVFLMPISMSIITVLFSIIGMIFYDSFYNSKILGLIIIITSIIAIWCIFEIFHLITKFISTD
ncbi:hypothetical protein HYW19_02420 [Candidatus Woesearchaeota archaeon]|nr:hypothetical protein [Candidatus Woesearchaeota archaeon]